MRMPGPWPMAADQLAGCVCYGGLLVVGLLAASMLGWWAEARRG